jgi:hypothetical protein
VCDEKFISLMQRLIPFAPDVGTASLERHVVVQGAAASWKK